MDAFLLTIILAFIQLVAIVIHGYILLQYRKYCCNCDWWWDPGALIFFVATFIPIGGIIVCICGPIDYIRNIVEAVRKGEQHERLKDIH